MIILDTNVVSALMQPTPDLPVVAWLDRQSPLSTWTTAVTVFEIRTGIDALPIGHKRTRLEAGFMHALTKFLNHRILPFDTEAADIAGRLAADRRWHGSNVGVVDTQVAGIALAHRAIIATRNVKDFRDLGARVVNPWDEHEPLTP